jgi:uncharacterized protein YutE (UPF0331/DUF86 family)
MELDKDLIQDKIAIIEKNLNFLSKYDKIDENEFKKSYKDIQAVKFSLFESIEACLDIASHIISVKGFKVPTSYSEMFLILSENNLIDLELSNNLSNMAKFRNLLIHSYNKIDNLKVLSYIKDNLNDIRSFIKIVLKLIKK